MTLLALKANSSIFQTDLLLWMNLSADSIRSILGWISSTSDACQEVLQDRGGSSETFGQEQRLIGPVVAIVGQPNVGKSALFNALVGGRRALVYNTPKHGDHVTRDIRSETTMSVLLKLVTCYLYSSEVY